MRKKKKRKKKRFVCGQLSATTHRPGCSFSSDLLTLTLSSFHSSHKAHNTPKSTSLHYISSHHAIQSRPKQSNTKTTRTTKMMITKMRSISIGGGGGGPIGRRSKEITTSPPKNRFLLIRRISSRNNNNKNNNKNNSNNNDDKKDGLLRCGDQKTKLKSSSLLVEDGDDDIFHDESLSIVPYDADEGPTLYDYHYLNNNNESRFISDDDDDDDGDILDLDLNPTHEEGDNAGGTTMVSTATNGGSQYHQISPSSSFVPGSALESKHNFKTPLTNNNSNSSGNNKICSFSRSNNPYPRFIRRKQPSHSKTNHDGRSKRNYQQQRNRDGGLGSSVGVDAAHVLSDAVEETREFVDKRLVPTALDATKDVAKYIIPAMRDALNETLQGCVRDLGTAFRDSSTDLGTSMEALGNSMETSMDSMGTLLGTSLAVEGRPVAEVLSEESTEWRRLVSTVFETVPEKFAEALFVELRRWTCEFILIPFISCLLVAADLYSTGEGIRNETRLIVFILILLHWCR